MKFREAYRRVYFNPRYLIRSLKKLRSIEDLKRNYDGLKTALGMSYR